MRESQDLDTDLSRTRDLTGRRIRISVKRSESAATLSAAHDNDDAYSAMEEVSDTSPVSSHPEYISVREDFVESIDVDIR